MNRVSFTDCVELVGEAPKKYSGEKFYVSTGAVICNEIDQKQMESVSFANKPSRANLVAEAGDILFAKMQNTHKVLLLNDNSKDYLYSTGFFAVRAKKQFLTNECLFYLLNSPQFLNQKDKFCSGATQKAITNEALTKLIVCIPEISEQEYVVKNLDKINALVEKRKQQLEKLDLLVKSKFIEMFGTCLTNEKGWELCTLEHIADVGSSKRVFVDELQSDGIPFYRGTEVGLLAEGQAIVPELFISEEHYKLLIAATGTPTLGDLLMPSICPDGRIWIVNNDNPFYFKDGRVLWIHLKDKRYNSIYIKHVLKDIFTTHYASIASGTTFAELKIFALKTCKIFCAPFNKQTEFARFVEQTEKLKIKIKQNLEELETLKKALMQKYFG